MTTEKRQNPQRFSPSVGRIYENVAGGSYLCQYTLQSEPCSAWMQNTASGWTCLAHGIVRYDNGTIEWDYSTEGHFEKLRRNPDATDAAIIHHRQISLANAMLCFLI